MELSTKNILNILLKVPNVRIPDEYQEDNPSVSGLVPTYPLFGGPTGFGRSERCSIVVCVCVCVWCVVCVCVCVWCGVVCVCVCVCVCTEDTVHLNYYLRLQL